MQAIIDQIRNKLNEPLPGIDAQYEMAPVSRKRYPTEELETLSYRKSAVMLLICKETDKLIIPLTKRHEYDGKHSGQVSLPGGKFEEHDITLQNTALRECYEEIGLKHNIEIIGKLTPLYIPVSNFYVAPFVGIYDHELLEFKTNEREVKTLIKLNIEDLRDPKTKREETIVSGDGYKLKTPYFDVEGNIVWGATAMILNEFRNLII